MARLKPLLATLLVLTASGAAASDCDDVPLFCKNSLAYPAKLAAKQSRMRDDGAPDRLTRLLARDGACLGCLQNGPDVFTILNVNESGDSYTITWDADNERIAHQKVDAGELAYYYVFNSRLACKCLGEPTPEQRPDYDSKLEINTDLALLCRGGAATAACP